MTWICGSPELIVIAVYTVGSVVNLCQVVVAASQGRGVTGGSILLAAILSGFKGKNLICHIVFLFSVMIIILMIIIIFIMIMKI